MHGMQSCEQEKGSFHLHGTICNKAASQNPDTVQKLFLSEKEPEAGWYMGRSQFEYDITYVFPDDL